MRGFLWFHLLCLFISGVLLGLGLLAWWAVGAVASPLSDQATQQRRACRHHAACWPQYSAILLGVNARVLQSSVAAGVARATGRPVEVCACRAGRLLRADQRVMVFSRRRFRDWWRRPGTGPGRRLRNCLLAAGASLAASVTHLAATGEWDDADALSAAAASCGFAAYAGAA